MRIHEAASGAAGAIARTYTRQLEGGAHGLAGAYGAGRPRTDQVTLSATRQEVVRMQNAVAGQPDVRADRVSALQAAIANGTYQVDGSRLAAKLLR